jgi:hypothetical protein
MLQVPFKAGNSTVEECSHRLRPSRADVMQRTARRKNTMNKNGLLTRHLAVEASSLSGRKGSDAKKTGELPSACREV